MTDQPLRAIIVDDEELARRGIEIRLANYPDVQVIAQCANGREAIEAVTREQPDLMFLDIQMPGVSGLEVLARLPQESMPMIIFVTAFDRYALDAFEAQALDYLLKPINDARFAQALERVRTYWRQRTALAQREKLMRLLASTQGAGAVDESVLREQLAAQSEPAVSRHPADSRRRRHRAARREDDRLDRRCGRLHVRARRGAYLCIA